jgi:hypothetical protein
LQALENGQTPKITGFAALKKTQIPIFPIFFPVIGDFGPEIGSVDTASAAIQCRNLNSDPPVCRACLIARLPAGAISKPGHPKMKVPDCFFGKKPVRNQFEPVLAVTLELRGAL